MKIVCTDNFARDYISEHTVAENITSEAYAATIAEALNAKFGGEHSQDYFVVKPDDYQPYTWEP